MEQRLLKIESVLRGSQPEKAASRLSVGSFHVILYPPYSMDGRWINLVPCDQM
jgi:hypothetical protein